MSMKKIVAAAGGALVAGVASAQSAIDVSSTVTGIGNQLTSVLSVGGAILGIVVAIVAFRWVRRVLR